MPAKKKAQASDDALDLERDEEGEEEMPVGMHLVEESEDEADDTVQDEPSLPQKKGVAPVVDEQEETDEEAEEEDEEIDEDDELKALDILERRLRREENEPANDNELDEDLMAA